jgi:nucleoside-diphosphate-sugar epimerase
LNSPPPCPQTVVDLDTRMTAPSPGVIEAIQQTPGQFAVLGAGGKMGFHISLMLQRCLRELGRDDPVMTVSRFGDHGVRQRFADAGFQVISADLSSEADVQRLPLVPNVVFLAGVKFGTGENSALLQRMNVLCPQLIAQRFHASRIVALSTGCVYSFTTPESGGSVETDLVDPPGAYAVSCLGRENAFRDAARDFGTQSVLIRLNYAIDLRYGVLLDIATRVMAGEPVSVEMGYVNVIWQGDAVAHILQSFPLVASPPDVLNVTGQEVHSVRKIAEEFGTHFQKPVEFSGTEQRTAWLNNAGRSHRLFGEPAISLSTMIAWTAEWLKRGGPTLDKPTHFDVRSGKY